MLYDTGLSETEFQLAETSSPKEFTSRRLLRASQWAASVIIGSELALPVKDKNKQEHADENKGKKRQKENQILSTRLLFVTRRVTEAIVDRGHPGKAIPRQGGWGLTVTRLVEKDSIAKKLIATNSHTCEIFCEFA